MNRMRGPRAETYAARRVTGGVDDLEATEDREHVAVVEWRGRARVGIIAWRSRPRRLPPGGAAERLTHGELHPCEVRRMDEDLDPSAIGQLAHAANVVGVAVSADDPVQFIDRPSDPGQVAEECRPRPGQPGIDEGESLFVDEEGACAFSGTAWTSAAISIGLRL